MSVSVLVMGAVVDVEDEGTGKRRSARRGETVRVSTAEQSRLEALGVASSSVTTVAQLVTEEHAKSTELAEVLSGKKARPSWLPTSGH